MDAATEDTATHRVTVDAPPAHAPAAPRVAAPHLDEPCFRRKPALPRTTPASVTKHLQAAGPVVHGGKNHGIPNGGDR
ncbi:hypothetical protein [Streptomyces sp. NPDC058092]|uniref:hypothetical protein n=1 Tax=Streptomyces sp. NPDC058092 TaxID=3346336 RepID=UPI0036EC67B0